MMASITGMVKTKLVPPTQPTLWGETPLCRCSMLNTVAKQDFSDTLLIQDCVQVLGLC